MRCWAQVNLSAIRKNLKTLQKQLPRETAVMAVIKADAYGHGVIPVARLLAENNIQDFCVATVEEGVELREAGFKNEQILVFGAFFQDDIASLLENNLLPTLSSFEQLRWLTKFAQKQEMTIPCHIKVDTGMHRYGFSAEELVENSEKIFSIPELSIRGLYSHLSSSSNSGEAYTDQQIEGFQKICDFLELNNLWFGRKHLANSGGILHYPEAAFDAVRPGLSLYGYWPGTDRKSRISLAPAMSLRSRIAAIREISAGSEVGYDRTFRAKRDMKIALLPVGYADGYSTAFSNRGQVFINRKPYPVIGKVCMDTTLVDISGSRLRTGTEVILWGGNYPGNRVEEVAASIDSIPYELTCMVSRRVKRHYVH